MTEAVKICGVLVAAAMMSLVLKAYDRGIAHLIGITGIVIASIFAIKSVDPVIEYADTLGSAVSDAVTVVVRVIGIAYITEFAASLCRDTGETSLAVGAELAGKAEIIVISFPLFQRLVELCTELLK